MSRAAPSEHPIARLLPAGLSLPALVVLLLWCALVGLIYLTNQALGTAYTPCPFFNLTGYPCPTCGGTRAAFELVEFRPLRALVLNPLVTLALVFAPAWLVARMLSPRLPALSSTRWFWGGLGLAALVNWVYVLVML